MIIDEKKLSGETIFTGKVFTVEVDKVELPNGAIVPRERVLHNGGVAVLAIDENENVIMVTQYRYGAGQVMLELPAGKLEKGESPMDAGLRELTEETGYIAETCTSLGTIIPTGAYCSERIYLYLVKGLTMTSTNPDEDEFVETVRKPLSEVVDMILKDEIQDAKTVAAVMKYIQMNKI